jgi:PAS domain S-box-containing protein
MSCDPMDSFEKLRSWIRLLLIGVFVFLVGLTALNLSLRYTDVAFALTLLAGIALLLVWRLLDAEIGSRAKVDAELRKNRSTFQAVLDHAPMFIVLKDLEGHYIFANRAMKQTTGESAATIIGKTTRDLYGNTEYTKQHDAMDREVIKTKAPTQLELTVPHVSSARTMLFTKFPLFDANGNVELLGSIALDVTDKKKADVALEATRARFQAILDHAPMTVVVKDLEGRYTFVNRRLEKWIEKDSAKLLGKTIRDLFGDSEYTREHEALDREVIATRKPIQREFTTPHPSAPETSLFAKFPLFDANRNVEAIGSIALDITDSRKVNDALLDSERLARGIIDTALDAFVQMDDRGHIIEWNAQAEKIFGWRREEAIGAPLSSLIIPSSYRARHDAGLAHFLQCGEAKILGKRLEIPAIRQDGQELPVELTVTALYRSDGYVFNGFIRDLTEKKKTDAALERFFETSIDLILVVDSKGNLLRVSPSSIPLLGYRPEEMVGHSAIDFIHSDDLERTRDEMRMARRGRHTRNFESRYIHKDGRAVTLSWTGVWSEQAKQHFFSGRDMSERMKLEQDLRQSQKMEAIGQLTGGIAHDYNNLLTVILGNAELLTEALDKQPELHSLAQLTLDAAERSATITQRLLAFGRRQSLESQATDINELLAGMTGLMQVTLGEQIKINLRPGADLWTPKLDRGQFETAVLNLGINARDAMPNGGTITIETANVTLDDDYVALNPGASVGEYVAIVVSDTGAGMTPEVLSRVFEPFFTTKEVGKGTGLGLSMIYGFAKQSGGHIAIYSEVGMGTVVRLYFPRTDAPSIVPAQQNPQDAPLSIGNEMILLVEDDPLVRAHTEKQLIALGYRVLTAEKAANALALIGNGLEPDLLLTDIVMPGGMNGRELADAARELIPGLKVLFTSGYTQGAIVQGKAHEVGSNFIGKPFRRAELASKIRETLQSKSVSAPLPYRFLSL